ncbi:MAG: HYR domain-containing protein, partial [Nitrospirae bacterium]|nr:HYR domain-containing protein [Nitrospirota bacterium]
MAVSGISTATAVDGGDKHTCAVLSDGTAKCWGSDDRGQLGNGTPLVGSFTPVAVIGIAGVVWSSSNTVVGTVNALGVATGLSLGTTTLTATSGSISGSTSLTVANPNHPPVANAGPDQTVEATSSSGASVVLNGSGSSDPDGNPLTYNWTGPFGAVSGVSPTVTMPLGTNTVTLTVSDGQASSTATVLITVHDTTPPVIAAHADVTAEATSSAGAVVTYTSPATSDAVDGAGVATCLPASGSTFPLGNTTVTCHATDAHGNAAAPTTFVVHVRDITPPTITVTQNPLPNANGWNKTDVTITFTATDAVSTTSCSPASVVLNREGANQ